MGLWLMRSSERKYLEQMRSKGEIFMHSLTWFTTCPDENRRDEHETVSKIEPIDTEKYPYLFFKPDGKEEFRLNLTKATINTHGYYGYIFCMHYLTDKTLDTPLNFDLKDRCVLMITNTDEFIKRLKSAAEEKQLKMWYGAVEYLDIKNLKDDKTPFKKDLKFAPDVEYRFYIQINDKEPEDELRLYIGDISDISVIQDLEVEKPFFKLTMNPNSATNIDSSGSLQKPSH